MDDPRESAVSFEGVKIRMNQTKDGVVLHLAVHPDEVPESLMRSFVGTRFQVAMVELDEQNEPVKPKEKSEGEKAVQSAALLCKDQRFQSFMVAHGYAFDASEEEAASGLREALGIASRSELATDKDARRQFERLRTHFEQEVRSNG